MRRLQTLWLGILYKVNVIPIHQEVPNYLDVGNHPRENLYRPLTALCSHHHVELAGLGRAADSAPDILAS